jgi:hypothetical protein
VTNYALRYPKNIKKIIIASPAGINKKKENYKKYTYGHNRACGPMKILAYLLCWFLL